MRRRKPSFPLNIRADEATEKLRRSLQRRLKTTATEVVKLGLQELAASLEREGRGATEMQEAV